ncbi:MAG: permease-like cell division protein FtsX [Patescibacteria group bacterium]
MIKHAVVEGFKSLVRSFWLSATAISVLTVSLGSVALIATLSTIVGFSVRQLDNQIAIVAYFNEGTPQDVIDQTSLELSDLQEVKEIKFVDREEAQRKIQESSVVADELVQSLQRSNIQVSLDSLEVTPNSSEEYASVEEELKSEKYAETFSEVLSTPSLTENLQRVYYWTRVIGVALVVIFGSISILVMINILRIAIYSFKDEIEIMRLVGATNNYIRAPFIMEGFYFNLIAAVIVTTIFVPSLNVFLPTIQEYLGVSIVSNSNALLNQIYFSLGLTIIVGMAVGIFTTYMATRRYLRL